MLLTRKKMHYRHLSRYGEIVSVLVRYGFGDLLSRVRVHRYFKAGKKIFRLKQDERIETVSRWDRIRMVLEALGPAFIKLGQFASNRSDLFPVELIVTLEKLQDAVMPFPSNQAVGVIEQELGKSVGVLFARFDERPFASASVAQVHRATLKNGGEVAVKVQRPNIEETITVDLEIMASLASLLEKRIEGMSAFNLMQLVQEFSSAINKEINFLNEARHIEAFSTNFRDDPDVYIPQVFHEFTTKKIITTEFIKGIKITNTEELQRAGLDRHEIARRGAVVILKQIFEHGIFHADPHAGNILIKEGNVICFLDFGMVGILTPSTRRRMSSVIIGLVRHDPEYVVRVLYELTTERFERREQLEYEVAELMQEYLSRPIGAISIGEPLSRLSRIMQAYRFRLVPGFYLLVKSLVTLEGIGLRLDPSFNLMEHLEPFARKLLKEQFGPLNLVREAVDTAGELGALMRDMPSETRDILHLIKSGRLRIEFEHRGLEPLLRKFDRLVNRLVYGLVLASLVIGSSVVVLSNIPPTLYGLPLIGIAGFLAAGIMGFSLLIAIMRQEKL